ncbi:hypothetical protein EDB81DRAFT_916360 [Dactylonectria macrodidyma]|uniref:Uncharacterized protein n=1 Tax=Dactylonectria macrodidyma TaxID=307937 RepID=A0A9P9IFH3_9HYPO|nr:hypothetical protein EDB81DRAFT_916360 [Dactylonectria macrodidyma]
MATHDQVDSPPLKRLMVCWDWVCRHLDTAGKRFIFILTIAAFAFTISGVFAGWEAVRIAKDTTALDRIADRLWLIGERVWLVYEALIWANRLLLLNFCIAPANVNNTICTAILNWTAPNGYLLDLVFELDPLNFNRSLTSPETVDRVPFENGLLSVAGGLATVILVVTTGPLLLGTLLLL